MLVHGDQLGGMNAGSRQTLSQQAEAVTNLANRAQGHKATRAITSTNRGHTAVRNTSDNVQTKVKSATVPQFPPNLHSSSVMTAAAKTAGPHPEMAGRNLHVIRAGPKIRSAEPACPRQFSAGTMPSHHVLDDTSKRTMINGDKRKKWYKDKMAGFDGGPSISARSNRHRVVQKETGAVPIRAPRKGTRPSPFEATSTSTSTAIEIGKSKGNAQVNQVSGPSSAIVDCGHVNGGRRAFYWGAQPEKTVEKKRSTACNNKGTKKFDDKCVWDARKQQTAAAMKAISFSKKVKEEEKDVRVSLTVGIRDEDTGERERESGDRDKTREAKDGGPGIPPPSLFTEPLESVSDNYDEDLYSPKEVDIIGVRNAKVYVQVKEEQHEDDDIYFDSPIPVSAFIPNTNTTIDWEQRNASSRLDNSASYPSDTECIIHPKNKRKQQNLYHANSPRSPKKAKTDVGENRFESLRLLNEDEGAEASTSTSKQGAKSSKKTKGKRVGIDEGETRVDTIGQEVPLTGTCAVQTEQGDIPTSHGESGSNNGITIGVDESGLLLLLPLSASSSNTSSAGHSNSHTGTEEATRDESTWTSRRSENAENAEQDERVEAEAENHAVIPSTTSPLSVSASVNGAISVKPLTPDSSKKKKEKSRSTENNETPTGKRKLKSQAAEAGEQAQGGGKETSHLEETPRKKRKAKDQVTEGGEGHGSDTGPVGEEGESHPDETPRKRTKMSGQTTDNEGGESRPNETQRKRTDNEEGESHPYETPRKRTKTSGQTTDNEERTQGGPVGDEHTSVPEKRKTTGVDSTTGSDIPLPDETPENRQKATDQSTREGTPEVEKKVVKRGRPPKKDGKGVNGETPCVKETEENGQVKEEEQKKRGRKKRASMDEKDGAIDGATRKKKRVKLGLKEGGDVSGKDVKSAVNWMLVCKNTTAAKKKASRLVKGKEKAAPDMDVDENKFEEGNTETRRMLRPSIWASSKTELLLVLPELSGSKYFNGVTEGSSNFPMVMLDESTAESISVDMRWLDGNESERAEETASIRLALVRDFVCSVADLASTAGILIDPVAYTAPSDAGPSSNVMVQPNVPVVAPGPSSVPNADGNGGRIDGQSLPVVLSHDDDDGMELEYIDEDVQQGGAVASVEAALTPVLLPHVPLAAAQEAMAMAHISVPALPTCHSIIPIGQHDSPPIFTPLSSLQNKQLIPFEQDESTSAISIPPATQIPVHSDETPTLSKLESELATIIPPSAPSEIEILTSSWRRSLPFILISSRETFNRRIWASPAHGPDDRLAAEHAFVFLGFFRVVKTDQRRVVLSDEEKVDVKSGKVFGRVEWTFDIEWVPGYDGLRDNGEELRYPWWAPDFVFGRPVRREGISWLEKYPQARLNLLPMQLVDGQEDGSSDEAMPKGWLCKACGKLNQKVMMRHRWCGSRMCRDNPLSRGYAVDLCSARDANQTPLALPLSSCDQRTVDVRVADWDDGMRTLKYRPMPMTTGERGGILKHVFTCNLVDLQTEATPLFESIQSEVCLMKSTGDSGPFFKCHVSDSYSNKREKYAFSCLTWNDAPKAVRDAQDLITFIGKEYGEEETLDIDHLTIVGWVSSGTRKTPLTLAAREHTITMLCLGNDVVLTIVPKWESSGPPQGRESPNMPPPAALPSSMPVAGFTPDMSTRSEIAGHMEVVDMAAAPAQMMSRNTKSKPKSKPLSESMSVTLVHGDVLLFSGCDFEYSIKRMGTSILVIGSKGDLTASI